MTGPSPIADGIARAEDLARAALDHWDAASLAHCSECAERLSLALREMEAARSAVSGPAGFPERKAAAGTVERLRNIQADIGRLTRLVGAASAFTRGMALLVGAAPDSGAVAVHEG